MTGWLVDADCRPGAADAAVGIGDAAAVEEAAVLAGADDAGLADEVEALDAGVACPSVRAVHPVTTTSAAIAPAVRAIWRRITRSP